MCSLKQFLFSKKYQGCNLRSRVYRVIQPGCPLFWYRRVWFVGENISASKCGFVVSVQNYVDLRTNKGTPLSNHPVYKLYSELFFFNFSYATFSLEIFSNNVVGLTNKRLLVQVYKQQYSIACGEGGGHFHRFLVKKKTVIQGLFSKVNKDTIWIFEQKNV